MYNKSKTYLLPLISEFVGIEKEFIKFLVDTYMYIENDDTPYLGILHDFSFKNPEFTAYENRLVNNDLFYKCIDLNNQVLYLFKFPEIYLSEFELFKESKYSEFGEDAKKLILKFWGQIYNGNSGIIPVLIKIRQILYKDEKLRKKLEKELDITIDENQELGEFVDINEETFKLV